MFGFVKVHDATLCRGGDEVAFWTVIVSLVMFEKRRPGVKNALTDFTEIGMKKLPVLGQFTEPAKHFSTILAFNRRRRVDFLHVLFPILGSLEGCIAMDTRIWQRSVLLNIMLLQCAFLFERQIAFHTFVLLEFLLFLNMPFLVPC